MYFVENRRVPTDITDGTEEKHLHFSVVQPQKQIRTIAPSSWLVTLCHMQWLLPLLTFCEKHQQNNHTLLLEPTKSKNEMRSDNNTSTGFVHKGTYLLLEGHHIFSVLYSNINYCIIKNNNTDKVTNDNEYLARPKGKYNIIDLSLSGEVPLVYMAFIFGVVLIVIFIFSLCVCFRSKRTLKNDET